MMMTNTTPTSAATTTSEKAAPSPAMQKVVIVNGSTDMLALLETVLSAGHYDVVFVESNEHAYSHIKRVQPNLVILCMCLEDHDGFQVLSMLKLDHETRRIPVLTYATEQLKLPRGSILNGVLIATGFGYTIPTAWEAAFARAQAVKFPGRSFRIDGAGTDYPSSPVRRYEALQAMGYV